MDDRGRFARSLTGDADAYPADNDSSSRLFAQHWSAWAKWPVLGLPWVQRCTAPLLALRLPRGIGMGATIAVIVAALGYGAVQGDHISSFIAWLKEVRNGAANAAGFRVASVVLSGNRHVSR